MKHRLKALERRLGSQQRQARRMQVVGDGERWQATVFDYSQDTEIVSMLWGRLPAAQQLTNAQLERMEGQGTRIERLYVKG